MRVEIDGVEYVPLATLRTVKVDGEVYVESGPSRLPRVIVDAADDRWERIGNKDMYECTTTGCDNRSSAEVKRDWGIQSEEY